MVERPTPNAAPNRAALFFHAGLVVGLLALLLLTFGTQHCPAAPEYSVVPAEVAGRQLYCISEAADGYKRLARNPVAQPAGHFCGRNKSELVAQAIAMSRNAAVSQQACARRRL